MTNISSINAYMKNMKRETGITMVEMMVTVAVIAIIVAIGLPNLQGTSRGSRLTGRRDSLVPTMRPSSANCCVASMSCG